MKPLFLYGTLRHVPLLAALTGGPVRQGIAATLADWRVDRQLTADLPMLVPHQGARTEGLVIENLTADQRARLDAYELPFGYHPAPVTVITAAGPVAALVYLPDAQIASSGEPWSLELWQAAGAPLALEAAAELAAHAPPLAGSEMVRQWPMILSRAEARLRAAATPAVATRRSVAEPQDWHLSFSRPLAGAFFKLAGLTLRHRRFDGAQSGDLPREVLVGVDAALVLPYDRERDRVLLVEQFRPAPALRGDRNPWALEPVAGIVDAGETPFAAALREAHEEAHLVPYELQKMFSIYASPGSTTDHFHCYLGLCALPDDHPRQGGLADEHEDLRLHLMSFDDALTLIESGEVNVGPLVAMLLWLARHRGGLRA